MAGGKQAAAVPEVVLKNPNDWRIMVITDLDKKSKDSGKGTEWHSMLQEGKLHKDPATGKFTAKWGADHKLISGHNEAGRGMELSELVQFNGHLMTMDDRTGIVYQIHHTKDWHMAPRHIIGEGDGTVDKGMKLEWATVKDGKLVVGSFGKEFTDDKGAIINTNNLWVCFIDKEGRITREDWTERYNKMRAAVDAKYPGYIIHEAANWSATLRKWVFLPRRISSDAYDDVKDEKMGSNTILIMDEAFTNVEVKHTGLITPERGFSSFKFVPGTNDQVIVALKSEENSEKQSQNTYITVFTLSGEVLLEETAIPGAAKFEGLEIEHDEL